MRPTNKQVRQGSTKLASRVGGALKDSETRYRRLFEAALDGILILDADTGEVTDVNPFLLKMLGYSHEEFLGKKLWDIGPIQDIKASQSAFRKLLKNGYIRYADLPLVTKDGLLKYVEVVSNVYLFDHKRVIQCNLHDITERKHVEETLRKSEELFRQLVENVQDYAIYMLNPEGTVLSWNVGAQRLKGYQADEIIGQHLSRFFIDEDVRQKKPQEILRKAEVEGRAEDEGWRVRKDGSRFWASAIITALRDPDGRLLGFSKVTRDMTERMQAERELRNVNRALHTLSECNQTLVRASDEKVLLNEICRIIVELGGYRLAWVGYAEQDKAKTVRPVAWAGQDGDYFENLDITWADNPRGRGPTGTAIRNGKPVAAQYILTDPSFKPWRERALKHGYASSLALPLTTDTQPFGALNIYAQEPEAFDSEEVKLLSELADDLAYGITMLRTRIAHHEAEEALHASLERYHRTLDNMLEGCQIIGLDWRYLYLNDAADKHNRRSKVELLGQKYMDMWPGIEATSMFTVIQRCMEERISSSIENEFIFPDGNKGWFELNIQPVPEGIFILSTDITERKRAEEQIQRQFERLKALRTIDSAISNVLDLRLTLKIALEQVAAQLGVDAADVLLFKPNTQTLEYAAAWGFRSANIEHSRLQMGEGHAGRAARERRTVHVPDLSTAIKDFVRADLLSSEGFVTYSGVPLITKGKVMGVLEVFNRTPLESRPEWVEFLETLGGQIAIAVDSAQMFNDLQRSNDDLSMAYDATIEGWSHAMDLRDKETEGHTQRVTELTVKLARMTGISEDKIVHIRRGALLHDMGKMGVPDNILLKPEALTDEEWMVMRRHPQYAYDMLSPIAYLRPALDIPYCHHEKWDGTGYPRGLSGEAIPLAARLFAVVDVWDALRSDRPYRAAWSEEKVLEHIKSLAGTHLDPKAVELFLNMVGKSTEGAS